MTSAKVLVSVSVLIGIICSVVVVLMASSFSRSSKGPFPPQPEEKSLDERSPLAARGPPAEVGLPSMVSLETQFLLSSVIPAPPELNGRAREFLTASLPNGIMAVLTPDGLFFYFAMDSFWSEGCSLPANLPSFTQSNAALLSLCDTSSNNVPFGACDWLVFLHVSGYASIRVPAGATSFDCTNIAVYPFESNSAKLESGPREVLAMQKNRVAVLGSGRINYFEIQSDGTFGSFNPPDVVALSSPSIFRCPDDIGFGFTSLTGVSIDPPGPFFSFSPPGGPDPFVQTILVCYHPLFVFPLFLVSHHQNTHFIHFIVHFDYRLII